MAEQKQNNSTILWLVLLLTWCAFGAVCYFGYEEIRNLKKHNIITENYKSKIVELENKINHFADNTKILEISTLAENNNKNLQDLVSELNGIKNQISNIRQFTSKENLGSIDSTKILELETELKNTKEHLSNLINSTNNLIGDIYREVTVIPEFLVGNDGKLFMSASEKSPSQLDQRIDHLQDKIDKILADRTITIDKEALKKLLPVLKSTIKKALPDKLLIAELKNAVAEDKLLFKKIEKIVSIRERIDPIDKIRLNLKTEFQSEIERLRYASQHKIGGNFEKDGTMSDITSFFNSKIKITPKDKAEYIRYMERTASRIDDFIINNKFGHVAYEMEILFNKIPRHEKKLRKNIGKHSKAIHLYSSIDKYIEQLEARAE